MCALAKKKAMYKYIDISKYRFSGRGVLLNSIMDIHCCTAEGGADQNRMVVDVRGGLVKRFHFVDVINGWSLNGKIIETRVRIWSFWFAHCMYQSYLLLIVYRFLIHLTSSAAKSLCMKCFDAEKLHCRVQASIFRLFSLIKRWNVLNM